MKRADYQKREELKKKQADAGLVGDKFPGVSGIVIKMTYYHRHAFSDEDRLLMLRTVNISPDDHAYFHMNCMNKECEGSFDLTPVIRGLVKKHQKHQTGNIVCTEKSPELPPNHASIQYEIDLSYSRKHS